MTEPAEPEALPTDAAPADAPAAMSPVRSMFAVIAGIVLYPIMLMLFMTMIGAVFPSLYPAPTPGSETPGPQTPMGLALILVGELVNGAVAGLIASRIAGRAPLAHAAALAGILGLFAMASMDQVMGMPGWFALGFATGGPLGAVCGGLLGRYTMSKRAPAS